MLHSSRLGDTRLRQSAPEEKIPLESCGIPCSCIFHALNVSPASFGEDLAFLS
jgi:hypothetical protein